MYATASGQCCSRHHHFDFICTEISGTKVIDYFIRFYYFRSQANTRVIYARTQCNCCPGKRQWQQLQQQDNQLLHGIWWK